MIPPARIARADEVGPTDNPQLHVLSGLLHPMIGAVHLLYVYFSPRSFLFPIPN